MLTIVIITFFVFLTWTELNAENSLFPLGIEPELFEPQDFDPEAPFCQGITRLIYQARDPCGFYNLNLDGNGHFKWIRSWCQCPSNKGCYYDKTDKRVRMFKLICALKEEPAVDEHKKLKNRRRKHHVQQKSGS